MAGAIHYADDETDDAYRFCVGVAARARRQGVEFKYRVRVSSLDARAGKIAAVICGRDRLIADYYVVAAGSYSAPLLRQVLPQASIDLVTSKPWCGLRALSADGTPIIGPTSLSNCYVSTGHGHLGWTMAAASAQLLSELISGDTHSIDPAPYSLDRFS